MKVLILGGTQFIGRHVVQALQRAAQSDADSKSDSKSESKFPSSIDITLANRGKTDPKGIPGTSQLTFDRSAENAEELKALRQNWDLVIDLSAYFPRQVDYFLSSLDGYIGRYLFCSTVSVYKESFGSSHPQKKSIFLTEASELLDCTPEQAVDASMLTYGQRKAECERVILKSYGRMATILRPSLVYGAFDHTDRLAYWIARATRNEPFLLPEAGLGITNKIYAPDLAQAFLLAAKNSTAVGQAYNVADKEPLSLADSIAIMGSLKNGINASSEQLLALGVRPWIDLPLWIPGTHFLVDTAKIQNQLEFRSTPSHEAHRESALAFQRENRAPKSGISFEAERDFIRQLEGLADL